MKKTNKMRKISTLFLAFALAISAIGMTVYADNILADTTTEAQPYYIEFTDVVKEVTEENGTVTGLVLGKDEVTAVFKFNSLTYIANADEIKPGDEVTGYIRANMPMIMIFPPQYTPDVVVVKTDSLETVKVDYFDSDGISSDGQLRLDPEGVADIKYQNGLDFFGEPKDLRLVVTYTASTMSIPAMPVSPGVVVLITDPDVAPQVTPVAIEEMPIVVNEVAVEGISAHMNDNGIIMVPLRKIAEALDFEVIWDDASQSIFLGNLISMKIDEDYYTFARMAPISLGTAPELFEGTTTYVPIEFFDTVAQMSVVWVGNFSIVIEKY